MRSLEEIKKSDYENLTYGELVEYDLGCNHCPLLDEFCSGGVACYGGEPIYPPCCDFDDETNLQEVCDEWYVSRRRHEEYEEKKERERELKRQKSEERKKKLREYRRRNWSELQQISLLKDKIKAEEKRIRQLGSFKTFANAINITNKMFRDAHQPNNVADVDITSYNNLIKEREEKIEKYNNQILEIKKKIKEKERELKKSVKASGELYDYLNEVGKNGN